MNKIICLYCGPYIKKDCIYCERINKLWELIEEYAQCQIDQSWDGHAEPDLDIDDKVTLIRKKLRLELLTFRST